MLALKSAEGHPAWLHVTPHLSERTRMQHPSRQASPMTFLFRLCCCVWHSAPESECRTTADSAALLATHRQPSPVLHSELFDPGIPQERPRNGHKPPNTYEWATRKRRQITSGAETMIMGGDQQGRQGAREVGGQAIRRSLSGFHRVSVTWTEDPPRSPRLAVFRGRRPNGTEDVNHGILRTSFPRSRSRAQCRNEDSAE